jgi:hypothetical protein
LRLVAEIDSPVEIPVRLSKVGRHGDVTSGVVQLFYRLFIGGHFAYRYAKHIEKVVPEGFGLRILTAIQFSLFRKPDRPVANLIPAKRHNLMDEKPKV